MNGAGFTLELYDRRVQTLQSANEASEAKVLLRVLTVLTDTSQPFSRSVLSPSLSLFLSLWLL